MERKEAIKLLSGHINGSSFGEVREMLHEALSILEEGKKW